MHPLLYLIVLLGNATAKEGKLDRWERASLAFHGGIFDQTAVREAVAAGHAVVLPGTVNETRLLHVDITVFQNTASTTRAQLTLFAVVESVFRDHLSEGRQVRLLEDVRGRYVVLDWQGRATSKHSYEIAFAPGEDPNTWTRRITTGGSAQRFHDELPVVLQRRLARVSGFLDRFPGQPVVAWEASTTEKTIDLLETIVSLAPSSRLIEHLGYEIAENAGKLALGTWLDRLARDGRIRHGHGFDLEDPRAEQFAEEHEKIGRRMWRAHESAPDDRRPPEAAAATTLGEPTGISARSWHGELALRWAPIHHQDVDRTGAHGLGGRADYITAIDFDGNWDTSDNWENTPAFPLRATCYYSVVETATHWFVVYAFYHPRDWSDNPLLFGRDEHENDLEGLMAIVRKPQPGESRFGALLGVVTVFHRDFYSFVPEGSPLVDGREDIDGELPMQTHRGELHPVTAQESKGHGLKAHGPVRIRGGDGVVYYPTLDTAEEPEGPNDRYVRYQLVDIFAADGLWAHRADARTFARPGVFRGDDGVNDAAHAPWRWDDHDDGPALRGGELARDPAKLASIYFRGSTFDRTYVRNEYEGIAPTRWPRRSSADGRIGLAHRPAPRLAFHLRITNHGFPYPGGRRASRHDRLTEPSLSAP